MAELHRLVERQLKRCELPAFENLSPEWQAFLLKVSTSYQEGEENNNRLAQSLEKSSIEMRTLYEDLANKNLELEQKVTSRTQELEHLLLESQENSERFQTIFNASPNPFLIFDENGILDCNSAAVKILNCFNKGELLRHHPADFSPEFQNDGQSSLEKSKHMDALAKAKGQHRFEWTHQKMDGTLFPVDVTLSIITLNGKAVNLVLWNDLTEKKQQEMLVVQQSKLASLGEMAGGVAHEINNPLAIISGYAGRIKKRLTALEPRDEMMLKDITMIFDTSMRIAKIVAGLRTFSRNAQKDPFVLTNMADVVTESLGLCSERFKINGVDLRVGTLPTIMAECRPTEISQVLVNLLNNAYDAVQEYEEKWVSIGLYLHDPEHLCFTITDSGKGIPPNVLEKIMQPFFTTKEQGKGTGLGLSISKGIAQMHGGDIRYDRHASNTTFDFLIALKQNPEAPTKQE